jgi:hypothetical protein
MAHYGLMMAFPLILTFSRREKELPLTGFVKPESSQAESRFDFGQTRGALLPLPAGEGRGEGELHFQSINYLIVGMALRFRQKRLVAWATPLPRVSSGLILSGWTA